MLLATACTVVAYIATVAPSREWNTINGGVRPPVFFTPWYYPLVDVVGSHHNKNSSICPDVLIEH